MKAATPQIIHHDPKTDREEFFIFVQIKIPTLPGLTPEGNMLGTILVSQILQSQLGLAGVKCRLGGSGWFNDSTYGARVDQLAPALAAIKDALATVLLLGCAEIAWYDSRESCLRIEHPVRDAKPLALEELEAKCAETGRFAETLTTLAELFKRSSK